jgi:hypothetical protein
MVQQLIWAIVMSVVFAVLGFVVIGILVGLNLINNSSVAWTGFSTITSGLAPLASIIIAVISLFAIFALLGMTGMLGGGRGKGK